MLYEGLWPVVKPYEFSPGTEILTYWSLDLPTDSPTPVCERWRIAGY
jgi:hypothetical protein